MLILTGVSAFLMLFPYYFNVPVLGKASSILQNWTVVVLAFAFIFGLLALTIFHCRKIFAKKEGWLYSVVLLVSAFAMFISGLIQPFFSNPLNVWLYTFIQIRINATVFALLLPFIASAAYRAFRANSIEAGLMLIAGLIVMAGNAPIFGYVWSGFPIMSSWINLNPNAAAQRGILIGVAVGTIALGVRILAGYERSILGE